MLTAKRRGIKLFFFFIFNPHQRISFYWFFFREKGRERERQRQTNISTWIWERNINWLHPLWVYGAMFQPTMSLGQGLSSLAKMKHMQLGLQVRTLSCVQWDWIENWNTEDYLRFLCMTCFDLSLVLDICCIYVNLVVICKSTSYHYSCGHISDRSTSIAIDKKEIWLASL